MEAREIDLKDKLEEFRGGKVRDEEERGTVQECVRLKKESGVRSVEQVLEPDFPGLNPHCLNLW